MTLFLFLTLTSQILRLLSAEQEAKTVGSEGDHWRSSTEEVCEVNGVVLGVIPEGVNVVMKIFEWTSPDKSLEDEEDPMGGPQARAKPSALP